MKKILLIVAVSMLSCSDPEPAMAGREADFAECHAMVEGRLGDVQFENELYLMGKLGRTVTGYAYDDSKRSDFACRFTYGEGWILFINGRLVADDQIKVAVFHNDSPYADDFERMLGPRFAIVDPEEADLMILFKIEGRFVDRYPQPGSWFIARPFDPHKEVWFDVIKVRHDPSFPIIDATLQRLAARVDNWIEER